MINNHLQVSDIGEKKLIERIVEKSNLYNDLKIDNSFNQFIGDDAALINFKNKEDNIESYIVATSDLLIQKYHFPKQMSYFQMGYKSVTANVSDLAAMGSNPLGILISLAIPKDLKLIYFDEVIDGILNACQEYNIPLIGGDTNQADQIIISGTALGKIEKKRTLKKYGFKKGDLIAITGKLGLAALGFEILKEENIRTIKNGLKNNQISQKIVDLAIEKALKPKARMNEGIILTNFASSATDITDGLASELYELFNADKQFNRNSNFGLRIYEDKLANESIFNEIYKVSKILNKDPLNLILHVGEDFELLFTFNSDENIKNDINNNINNNISNYNIDNIDNKTNDVDFIIIGEVNDSNRVEIEYSNGKIEELSSKGYEHLAN